MAGGGRQLHLPLPSSPTIYASDSKVTDMSLGSDGSRDKTPGFEGFRLRSAGGGDESGGDEELKRSISSTLTEEEEEETGNNNGHQRPERHDYASSDDNLLESLGRRVGELWDGAPPGRRTCCCHYRLPPVRPSPPTLDCQEEETEGSSSREDLYDAAVFSDEDEPEQNNYLQRRTCVPFSHLIRIGQLMPSINEPILCSVRMMRKPITPRRGRAVSEFRRSSTFSSEEELKD